MCAERTAAVDCTAGMPGRTPGGRRIEVMRAVASSADEVALRSHNRRLVRRLHAGPAQRLVFRGRFGGQGKLLMRCQRPSVVQLLKFVPESTVAIRSGGCWCNELMRIRKCITRSYTSFMLY